jgi:hypothetical protein
MGHMVAQFIFLRVAMHAGGYVITKQNPSGCVGGYACFKTTQDMLDIAEVTNAKFTHRLSPLLGAFTDIVAQFL